MNLLLRLFYKFLKIVVSYSLRIYHSEVVIINKAGLQSKGPLLVISNHPNTMLDPIHIASILHEEVFFLANYGLFKNPILGAILNTLYCIPIQRPQDTDGKPLNNKEAFVRCDAHLSKGGSMYIAPEGVSFMERRLREYKTGTARIAFSVEEDFNFELGLRVLPIGLTYYSPEKFGGKLLMAVGEPIPMAQFKGDFEKDPIQAARNVTEYIEQQTAKLMIDCRDEDEDELLTQVDELLQHEKPEKLAAQYQRSQQTLGALRQVEEQDADFYHPFKNNIAQYFKDIKSIDNHDAAVHRAGKGHSFFYTLWQHFTLLLGFPLYLYAIINHFFIIALPLFCIKIIKPYIGYFSTFKYGLSLVTVPLFYSIQTNMVGNYLMENFGDDVWKWAYLVTLPLVGMFAYWYQGVALAWWHDVQLILNPSKKSTLIAQRKAIITDLMKLKIT